MEVETPRQAFEPSNDSVTNSGQPSLLEVYDEWVLPFVQRLLNENAVRKYGLHT